jgi:hypothetical protein
MKTLRTGGLCAAKNDATIFRRRGTYDAAAPDDTPQLNEDAGGVAQRFEH